MTNAARRHLQQEVWFGDALGGLWVGLALAGAALVCLRAPWGSVEGRQSVLVGASPGGCAALGPLQRQGKQSVQG